MPEFTSQNLSAMVKARLLFRREIDIDAVSRNIFDRQFLADLERKKAENDRELKRLTKALLSAIFVSAFIISGERIQLVVLGQKISDLTSILDVALLLAGFSLVMCSFTFMNSQAYDALIDQLVNKMADDGLTDAEVIKAALAREWLIMKILRGDFSFTNTPYIRMHKIGVRTNLAALSMMIFIVVVPFIFFHSYVIYAAVFYASYSFFGTFTTIFCILSVTASLAILIVPQISFPCKIESPPQGPKDQKRI